MLFSINLGGVALRDWDEGTVAQVAREISQSEPGSWTWLYPTIAGGSYFNKPPLVHWLIALSYKSFGISEFSTRLPGMFLTAISVPLLYGVGRELFLRRTPAVFAALVYLTFLPVVRHGRLAMLDGAILCFYLLLIYCLLRTRRDLRWGLGVGATFALLCLTKGIVALLLGAIALIFIALDTPRLLRSGYVWTGVAVGSFPAVVWFGAQLLRYGRDFLSISLLNQSFKRVWVPVEAHTGPPWYYLFEILKYSLPWLLFLPWSIKLAWENRNLGWAKLSLVWAGGYLLTISLMATKLPWYVLPVYPALALMVGALLTMWWNPADMFGGCRQGESRYPLIWLGLVGLTAIAGWVGSFYFSVIGASPKPDLQLILTAVALTLTATYILAMRQNSQFILVLLWGTYLSLFLLMASRQWVWELNEAYPVKPVAQIVQNHVPSGQAILTSYPNSRPSLNFYSDRQVIPATPAGIEGYWQNTTQPYVLIDPQTLKLLQLDSVRVLDNAEDWLLVTKREPERAETSTPDKQMVKPLL